MNFRLGIDSGGTFTDVVLLDEETGRLRVTKTPSTPQNPSIGVYNGIQKIMEQEGAGHAELSSLVHGTTVATNALLEYKGVKTALILTRGFKDILSIVRQDRPKMYDYFERRPDPLIPRHRRFEVSERVLYNGDILEELDEGGVLEIIHRLKTAEVRTIAVCLLHSYANPIHELRIKEMFRTHYPESTVSLSCEILPEIREYERMSTTAINAYVMPIIDRYLEDLRNRMKTAGLGISLNVMQSNGGIMPSESASQKSVTTILSGPAGGVLGAQGIAQLAGFQDVITLDMGGTSCDICLIDRGQFLTTKESEIGGHAIRVPMIDINTIGAGGGSIAWIDTGGLLRVGPQSAAADPGPACYGKGGLEPTVTDADLILGRLNPQFYVGGEMTLDKDRAEAAIRERIAEPARLTLEEASEGIIQVVNANMIRGIRRVSVERGHDPRDFSLLCFGGGGPLHATDLAAGLSIPTVIIPVRPGVNSALGLLVADFRYDYSRTCLKRVSDLRPGDLDRHYEELETEALRQMQDEQISREKTVFLRSADMRYFGQGYEIEVAVPQGEIQLEGMVRAFNDGHARLYGYSQPEEEIEIVYVRVAAIGLVRKPDFYRESLKDKDASPAFKGTRRVFIDGDYVETALYDRSRLVPNNRIQGPAIVEQFDSTTLLKPAQIARVDEYFNLIVQVNGS
jgi:N-methylhydantoinase A